MSSETVPLEPVLLTLGVLYTTFCISSFLRGRIRPPGPQHVDAAPPHEYRMDPSHAADISKILLAEPTPYIQLFHYMDHQNSLYRDGDDLSEGYARQSQDDDRHCGDSSIPDFEPVFPVEWH